MLIANTCLKQRLLFKHRNAMDFFNVKNGKVIEGRDVLQLLRHCQRVLYFPLNILQKVRVIQALVNRALGAD